MELTSGEDKVVLKRERATIFLVATGHAVSHFYLLILIPLLPLLKATLGVDELQLTPLSSAKAIAKAELAPPGKHPLVFP